MNAKLIRWLLIGCLLVVSVCEASDEWKNFPVPHRMETWWVSQGSIHNGHTLSIKRFKTPQSIDSVLDFYRAAWQSDADLPGFMETDANQWRMISRLALDFQWVVQIKASATGRGSEGIISQMWLNSTPPSSQLAEKNFMPMPQGGVLVSSTQSTSPTTARTQTQLFSGRPETVANRYKRFATKHGWLLQDEYVHGASVAQRFERSQRKMDVALVASDYGKTLVFVSEVLHESR